ncbi:MAG: response regulator [Candidatus Binataceae bacterium]|jgi:PAS domain S-box-containing protein
MDAQPISSVTFAKDASALADAAAAIASRKPAMTSNKLTLPAGDSQFRLLETDQRVLGLRVGAICIVLFQITYLIFIYLNRLALGPFSSLGHIFNIACPLLLVAASFRSTAWLERFWRITALLACTIVTLNMGFLAILEQEARPLLVSSILFPLATALLLPWEPAWQAASSAVAVITTLSIGALGTSEYSYPAWMGLFSAAAVGQAATIIRTRFRQAKDHFVAELAASEARQRALVAERERAAWQLANSEAMLRRVFDSTLDSILILRFDDSVITHTNRAFHEEFGYERQAAIGAPPSELGLWAKPADPVELRRRLEAGGAVRNLELTLRRRDGALAPVLVSAALTNLNGQRCVVSTIRDITQIKRAERDLIAAREAALAASRAKSEFLSSMSHEIRTPMNMILGNTDLLAETKLDAEQIKYLAAIHNNGNSLLRLLNDILDLAKMESGRMTLEPIQFDLEALLDQAAEAMATRASAKNIELVTRIAPDVPLLVIGDATRIHQILINLAGNAIKFTERGEIVISAWRENGSDLPVMLHFSVRDTGIGISASQLEEIFADFTQADSSNSRLYGGSGLGLAIVRRLADLMGGRAWAESTPGAGSTFHFTMRVEVPSMAAPAVSQSAVLPARILVIDDSQASRRALKETLAARSATVESADNGPAGAARAASALAEGHPFDVILLDARMPGMDGFAAAAEFKRQSMGLGGVVMMLSADDLNSQLTRMRELGLEHYAVKPIRRTALLDAIAKALVLRQRSASSPIIAAANADSVDTAPSPGPSGTATSLPAASASDLPAASASEASSPKVPAPEAITAAASPIAVPSPAASTSEASASSAEGAEAAPSSPATGEHPLRMLLTDDSADNRTLIKAYCKRLPWQIDDAENGEAALRRFSTTGYDIVLMDLQMPVMDGLAAIRAMRSHEASNHLPRTPIIALTASALDEDVHKSLDAGADAHVSKPINKATLLDAVRAATANRGLGPSGSARAA